MPISLRLPVELETQIASLGARSGLTKTAVIVRSIQEYLAAHAQQTSQQIYEEAMRGVGEEKDGPAEQRPHKIQAIDAIRRKHARRSARARKVSPKRTAKRPGGKSA